MRRYFFQVHGEHGTEEDPPAIALSDNSAALLRAVTMCAEIGRGGGFDRNFAVSVRDERGTEIGWVSVVVATNAADRSDA